MAGSDGNGGARTGNWVNPREGLMRAALGDAALDLVIRGGSLVNVYTGETERADIGIYGDRIALVDRDGQLGLQGRDEIDARGLLAIPGYVDTHVHIESTMVTPPNFARGVLPRGTTTVVIDPHEIGNVLGRDGVEYMLRSSEGLPLRVFLTIPSSVPAVPGRETAGASFEADDVAEMLTWPRVVGVAELMDYPGIIKREPRASAIVAAGLASGKALEGHCPHLSGRELAAYLAAGVDSDHESRGWKEMVEKLRAGMWIYGRENTFRHTAAYLARALREIPSPWNVALCTDDIDPADLLDHGHIDRGVRVLVEQGVDPALVVRIATLNGAVRYGLQHDLGAIAPGKLADLLLVEKVGDGHPRAVLVGGQVVARDGQLTADFADPAPPPLENSVRITAPSADWFRLKSDRDGERTVRVLELDAVRTTTLGEARLPFVDGTLAMPLPEGLALLSVVPRHGQAHPPSLTLLRGLSLRSGALASSVAHDSHNLIVAGRSPEDMAVAARAVAEIGGGVVLAVDGEVVARVRLPVAGLLSAEPVETAAAEVRTFNEVARRYGIGGPSPAVLISSLALPVSPFYRLTDLGIVDTLTQEFVEPVIG